MVYGPSQWTALQSLVALARWLPRPTGPKPSPDGHSRTLWGGPSKATLTGNPWQVRRVRFHPWTDWARTSEAVVS